MPSYKNGNYWVHIDSNDGSKLRYTRDNYLNAQFPESLDIKITNKCHIGCSMCHEASTPDGLHGNILNNEFLNTLHPYTELAIGGGDPLEHPDLEEFLIRMKEKKIFCNITVHQNTFVEKYDFLKHLVDNNLVKGIGVSVFSVDPYLLNLLTTFPNIVCHVIAGIVDIEVLRDLAYNNIKILILGYKILRRGENCYKLFGDTIAAKIEELKNLLSVIKEEKWFEVVSFDNLALKQLDVKSLLDEDTWNSFYMGSDGEFTGYINVVDNYFAVSSTKLTHWPITDNIEDMFKIMKENKDCE